MELQLGVLFCAFFGLLGNLRQVNRAFVDKVSQLVKIEIFV